jgi:hypothetical protein
LPGCAGWKYDPATSPRRAETPPRYITARINRNDGPEDSSLGERCLTGGLPEFGGNTGSFRRIVQTPGGISIFYDVGQGQGWQRNIVMNGSPHLPANIHQWYGDSRGHWEGDTLVVDVTNFSPKTDVFGSRENLHLVERWARTGPMTFAYEVTIEDPTVWTRPWTVKQEFSRQSDEENRLYTEPRCIEGNQGLPGLLHGRRVEDLAFAEGRGPDPATKDNTSDFASTAVLEDPLQQYTFMYSSLRSAFAPVCLLPPDADIVRECSLSVAATGRVGRPRLSAAAEQPHHAAGFRSRLSGSPGTRGSGADAARAPPGCRNGRNGTPILPTVSNSIVSVSSSERYNCRVRPSPLGGNAILCARYRDRLEEGASKSWRDQPVQVRPR